MQYRTQPHDTLGSVLTWLNKLAPAQHLVHIGAGTGTGSCHAWRAWPASRVTLIDANAERLAWAEQLIDEHPDWKVQAALVAAKSGATLFYRASNPDENGLLPPEQLKSIWPNLATENSELQDAVRLDDILSDTAPADWLIVDCLPALPILLGAERQLAAANVLSLRCMLNSQDSATADASLSALETMLQPLGFRCIDTIEGNHPAIGHALFVRDWQDEKLNLLDALTREHSTLQLQIEQLAQARDEQARLAAERQQQIDAFNQARTALEQEKSALAVRRDELQADVTALAQAHAQQAQLAQERQTQIELLTQARDEQARLAAERQQQIDAFDQARTALEQEKSALAARRDELENQLKQKDARIAQLEQDMAERDARQHLLNEEITRAEAQIDLIKDVLLREPGL